MIDAPQVNPLGVDEAALTRQYVLDKIASGESSGAGYNELYGGKTISDLSRHPGIATPIPGTHKVSTAAGRYQFLKGTWDQMAGELGLQDFSPASQDAAAWHLAQTTYRAHTGRDLASDAQKRAVEWSALGSQWESLAKAPPDSGAGPSPLSYSLSIPDETLAANTPGPGPADFGALQKVFSHEYKFSPVDYDPFEVEKAMKGEGK